MKKSLYKLIALLVFASVALSSCSVEYRDRHRKQREARDHQHDHDHDHDNDHHYDNH